MEMTDEQAMEIVRKILEEIKADEAATEQIKRNTWDAYYEDDSE